MKSLVCRLRFIHLSILFFLLKYSSFPIHTFRKFTRNNLLCAIEYEKDLEISSKKAKIQIRNVVPDELFSVGNIFIDIFESSNLRNGPHRPAAASMVGQQFYDRITESEVNKFPYKLIAAVNCPNDFIGIIEAGNYMGEVLGLSENLTFLSNLGVLPSYRRMGIATALVHAAEEYLRLVNCSSVYIAVENNNLVALRLYQSLNYISPDSDDFAEIEQRNDVTILQKRMVKSPL
jgi:ribosomal protein S18 acetylase RimI-like enzyme